MPIQLEQRSSQLQGFFCEKPVTKATFIYTTAGCSFANNVLCFIALYVEILSKNNDALHTYINRKKCTKETLLDGFLSGHELWDLGMYIPYKDSLGAKKVLREDFLRLFRQFREEENACLVDTMQKCCEEAAIVARSPEGPNTALTAEAESFLVGRRVSELPDVSEEESHEAAALNTGGESIRNLPQGFLGCCELFHILG